jgi:hypothetical protein
VISPSAASRASRQAFSSDGSVVVGQGFSASGLEAFRWTADTGIQRLWDLLLAQGVDLAAAGWSSLTTVFEVSADGQTLVGSGVQKGNTEAFVAVIPEPAELSLIGCTTIVLCRRRRRA